MPTQTGIVGASTVQSPCLQDVKCIQQVPVKRQQFMMRWAKALFLPFKDQRGGPSLRLPNGRKLIALFCMVCPAPEQPGLTSSAGVMQEEIGQIQ